MATITGQAGVDLSSDLAAYLSANQGNLTSEQLTQIINQYLTGGDKLAAQGGSITNGIYKRFGEFDQVTGKVEVVTPAEPDSFNDQFPASIFSLYLALARLIT